MNRVPRCSRWALALLTFSLAAQAATIESPEACAGCHPAETRLHQRSRMAHAMTPALESAFGQNLPDQPLHESGDGYSFLYRRTIAGVEVTTERGADHATGLIKWVLGAGAQGETPLVEDGNGHVSESHVSYFPQLHQYGITVGQHAGASLSAVAALGRRQNAHDLQACISCHASAITQDLRPVIPGVQCQVCHSGAEEHARDTSHHPVNPGKLPAPEQVRFCGNCHRVKPLVDDAELENVRFQPLRLMKSRCFGSGQLACTTCHPAHQDAVRNNPAFYNEKCHSCHDERAAHRDARQTGDCIGCHMPYVQLHPALRFTDHYIRVVKAGDLPADVIRQRNSGS